MKFFRSFFLSTLVNNSFVVKNVCLILNLAIVLSHFFLVPRFLIPVISSN